MIKKLYHFFSSIKLTVFLLVSSLFLIFFGTLDQVQFGIYHTQQKYFEHVFVVWDYPIQWLLGQQLRWLHIPMPGGYLLGPLLIINLVTAHFRYFRPSWKKAGIGLIHGGVVLLLVGQLLTQLNQKEYFLWLSEGQSRNYIESFHYDELVLIDTTNEATNTVYSWDARLLKKDGTILEHPDLPFTLESIWWAENAAIFPRPQNTQATFPELPANRGLAKERDLIGLRKAATFAEGERNVTSAVVRITAENNSEIGSWLVSNIFRQETPVQEPFPHQTFEHQGRTYQIALRFTRQYLPAKIHLLDFQHDRYPGTDIPFNFSSKVEISEMKGQEALNRETLIYMNHPLRYAGLTFYQASFADNDTKSMFQVVKNPARWIPYAACLLTTLGLVLQFTISLISHSLKGVRK